MVCDKRLCGEREREREREREIERERERERKREKGGEIQSVKVKVLCDREIEYIDNRLEIRITKLAAAAHQDLLRRTAVK